MPNIITFHEINSHMDDSEDLSNTKWIRDEMRRKEYYIDFPHNDSMSGPKYFSDYSKLIKKIHDKIGKSWTLPIPVFGYMGEVVYISLMSSFDKI